MLPCKIRVFQAAKGSQGDLLKSPLLITVARYNSGAISRCAMPWKLLRLGLFQPIKQLTCLKYLHSLCRVVRLTTCLHQANSKESRQTGTITIRKWHAPVDSTEDHIHQKVLNCQHSYSLTLISVVYALDFMRMMWVLDMNGCSAAAFCGSIDVVCD